MSDLKEIKAIGVLDYDDWTNPKSFTYVPEPLRPQDVDIKILACGICGSDIHAANGDWGRKYTPLCVGHEIVGIVIAVGDRARFKIGDRVGVGSQCDCCHSCKRCNEGNVHTCKTHIDTYLSYYPSGKPTQGGYASHVRVNSEFAFKIPDNLETNYVAPLLCGGITAFKPMISAGVSKGTKVGINGIGGIGHIAIMFAKALGAEVTAISRTFEKEELAKALGADHYISTNDPNFVTNNEDSLDLIINTGSSFTEGSINQVLQLLNSGGRMTFITSAPVDEMLTINPLILLLNNISIGGSLIGSPKEIEHMLEVASEHNIKPMIETIDINETNVKTAWKRMVNGDVRFRFVLTGYDKYFV